MISNNIYVRHAPEYGRHYDWDDPPEPDFDRAKLIAVTNYNGWTYGLVVLEYGHIGQYPIEELIVIDNQQE